MRVPVEPGKMPAVRVRRSDGVSFCVVRWLPDGSWTGTCEGYQYRRYCRHIRQVQDKLRELKAA